jgi:hypothetical protein
MSTPQRTPVRVITVDRLAQGKLDRVFRAYAKAGRKG